MTLTAYGDNAQNVLKQAQKRINELDKKLSVSDKNSEVSKLNSAGKGTLSADCAFLMEKSLSISRSTNGAFNPMLLPLTKAWGFTDKNYNVPNDKQINALLKECDISKVRFDKKTGEIEFLQKGMAVDFGGIAKGYASDEVKNIFRSNKVNGIISLGGNIWAIGSKENGEPWKVAVKNPDSEEKYLGTLSVSDKAIVTSGSYERYFEKDGKVYHHILDPKTGCPAESHLKSVTIISNDGTLADGLSTALFVMGLDKAIEYQKSHSQQFDAVFYTDDGGIFVTKGIAEQFSSDYKWSIAE